VIEAVLLVPGSWRGAWCYDAVAERLADLRVVAIDLPSNDGAAGLAEDAAAVRDALDGIGERALAVGHSYGGIAISEGAAGSAHAAALVYLCAFMLEPGQALLDAMHHELPPWIALDEAAGTHLAQGTDRSLYGDCPADVAKTAAERLTPQSVAAIATPQTVAAWQALPSTYVICEKDQAVPPPVQEAMASRAATVERLPSSHSPFLSCPDDVAAIVRRALS